MDPQGSPANFEVTVGKAGKTSLWTHLQVADDTTDLLEAKGVPPSVIEALVVSMARPRAARTDEGLIIVLRGVNLAPGADPEDMVSVRMWLTDSEVVTVCPRRMRAIEDVRASLATPAGPHSASAIVAATANALVDRMEPVIDQLNEDVETIEAQVFDGSSDSVRTALSELRRTLAQLRRHLAPQRDAIRVLQRDSSTLLSEDDMAQLRELGERTARYVEDLDAIRERTLVVRDELEHRAATVLNRNTYLMSVVAAVFLPIGFITGLLGINVGGMPGTNSDYGFLIVLGILTVVTLFELWLLRRLRIL